MLPQLVAAFAALPALRGLAQQLPGRGVALGVGGLPGSSPAVLVAALSRGFPHRAFLVVAATPAEAERWHADLNVLLGEMVRLYPQREALGEEEPHFEIAGERVETIEAVLSGRVRVLVTTLAATAELTRMARAVVSGRLEIRRGESARLNAIVDQLESMGYERCPSVLDVAQFAVRGGLVDVFGFGMAAPARVEWWGDEVISIREFDLDTQRSEREIDGVMVLPVEPVEPGAEGADRSTVRRSADPVGGSGGRRESGGGRAAFTVGSSSS